MRVKNLPANTAPIDNKPMHHWTPSLSQPLFPKKEVVNTNSGVLLFAVVARVTMVTMKKMMWRIPPMISTTARILRAKTLAQKGIRR